MPILPAPAFNLDAWIELHLPSSRGAIGNREVFKGSDFIFQIIKGPNARNDFHIDPFDEIFYQFEGHIFVDTIEHGKRVRHRINQGEVFLLPKNVYHSPRRPPGSLGLVIERPRSPKEEDGIAWFCENCGQMLHSVTFWCDDIETVLKQHVEGYNKNPMLRTCKQCGTVQDDPTTVPQWQGDAWK